MGTCEEGLGNYDAQETSRSASARLREMCSQRISDAATLPKRILKRTVDRALDSMNPEVAGHLLQSGREMLLAVRKCVDVEIDMTDKALSKVRNRQTAQESSGNISG